MLDTLPTEVHELLGDLQSPRSAGMETAGHFSELVKRMVVADLREAEKEQICRSAGFQ
jgi:GDPmannose 4,6-dehydratase